MLGEHELEERTDSIPKTDVSQSKWFVQWTIETAWSYGPKRFWLHTCTFDHPAALPSYTKAGFVQYKEEVIERTY